jgi:hypothetical protein
MNNTKEVLERALNNLKTKIKSEIRDAINNGVHWLDEDSDDYRS